MFAPKGWISLRDVYHYFVWYFSEHDSLGPYVFTGDECYELTWNFADEAESLSVCASNGAIIPVSRQLVLTDNECHHENEHINLYYGTVGSGEVLSTEEFPHGFTRHQYMEVTYGPFRNLPIIFLYSEFDAFIAELINDEETSSENTKNLAQDELKVDNSPRAVSQRILQVWRGDQSLTSKKLKEIVAPDQSFRAFRFAWGLAVMDQPKLSARGRRKKT